MGTQPLSPKSIRRLERLTGQKILHASTLGHDKQVIIPYPNDKKHLHLIYVTKENELFLPDGQFANGVCGSWCYSQLERNLNL